MNKKSPNRRLTVQLLSALLAFVLAVSAGGCYRTSWRAQFVKPKQYAELDKNVPFMKCHTKTGQVYVFDRWEISKDKNLIVGSGILYDADRHKVSKGEHKVPFSDVALIETNVPEKLIKTQFAVMGVVTGASLILTAVCIVNPKACFGSCPTFYTIEGDKKVLHAEGFSNAIARSLESTDVDSLFMVKPALGRFELLMTNDALETHAVRSLRLLAVPRGDGERVYRQGDLFYPSSNVQEPISCRSGKGECLEHVTAIDEKEYLSEADGTDLASRETIELEFPAVGPRSGLVIVARNSLMNTFLFYQALAYMGLSADDWMMKLETGGDKAENLFKEWSELLGKMEVEAQGPDGEWVSIGDHSEVGPIAKEMRMMRLPDGLGENKVRLRINANRGYWKIDYLGLAQIGEPVKPLPIEPQSVEREGVADPEALRRISNPDEILYTYPGDAYKIAFEIPEGNFELFLESRGFYYEWIRQQWLAEEDQDEAASFLLEPRKALRRLAPAYKKIEHNMEEVFWNSRIGKSQLPASAE